MPILYRLFTLILLATSLNAYAEDIDGDGIDSLVDINDRVSRYHVSVGGTHSCALDDNGVHCWGGNNYGQAEVPELSNPIQVTAGGSFTCAIDDSGVKCWGRNDNGQLTPSPGMEGIRQVSAGSRHACALHDSGVSCWGYSGDGQLTPPPLINPIMVSAGAYNTCALDDEGMKCWGDSGGAQSPALIDYLTGISSIATGRNHTCALHDVGINCWGSNSDGQSSIPSEMRPYSETNPRLLAAGAYQTCATDDNGTKCWGRTGWTEALAPAPNLEWPTSLSAGIYHACALDSGNIECWGSGRNSVLGGHVLHSQELPHTFDIGRLDLFCSLTSNGVSCRGLSDAGQTEVPSLANPTELATGENFACAVDNEGLECWGSNSDGRSTPPSVSNPSKLVASAQSACVLDAGTPVCWGSDSFGLTSTPTLNNMQGITLGSLIACTWDATEVHCWGRNAEGFSVQSLSNTRSVAAGNNRVCALSDEGVTCWNSSSSFSPDLINPTMVTAGSGHHCSIDDEGVKCWGSNTYGQITVPELSAPYEVQAFGNYTCALDDDGAKCWGRISDDKLDIIPELRNPRKLSVKEGTACVVTDDGLRCWGRFAQIQAFAELAPSFQDADGDRIPDEYDSSPYDPTAGGTLNANTGGPYSISQGALLTIDGSLSSTDTQGVQVESWLWDKDDSDGIDFSSPDATGKSATVTYSLPGDYVLSLRVEDSLGRRNTASTLVNVLADSDGDEVPDEQDDYPALSSASTDADGDGFPDDCTSNQECLEDGLTPDPSLDDFDNDGIPTAEDSNDNLDTAPPSVIAAGDISLVASGEITLVDLLQESTPYASDFPNTVLAVLPKTEENNTSVEFESGQHQIEWCASDAAGNEGCDTQIVEITPLASFTTVSQIAAEGEIVDVEVRLSGNPIQYPVKIPLRFNETLSTADNPGDHDASSQMISILEDDPLDDLEANMGRMQITITDDGVTGEADESITLELVTELDGGSAEDKLTGAALGPQPGRTHIVTITEENVPPAVEIISDGQISLSDSSAKATVEIDDPNNHPSYFISWYLDGEFIASGTDLLQVIYELGEISEGEHTLRVTVLDTGSPPKQGEDETVISYEKPSQTGGSGSSSSGGGSITLMLLVSLAVLQQRQRQRRRS